MIPLQIIDDISDFKGTTGFGLKGLAPMYNIISDYEGYQYRKNVLANMEKAFAAHRAEWDYQTYQMKQTMLDMQKKRINQLEIKYNTAMEQLKTEFELKVRYGMEEQYRQYLAAARYADGAIIVKREELKKTKMEYRTLTEDIRKKREVNDKMISLLKTMDISDKSLSDEVKKMVSAIIAQLNDDTFIAVVSAEEIVPLLRQRYVFQKEISGFL